MQERRQHKRFAVEHVKVNGEMPLASYVKIMDLGMNGILVKADRRLNIGNKYSLKIGYKGKVLFVKATVMRSLLVESVKDADGDVKPIYLAGMQFTDVSNEKIEEIINLIEADTQTDGHQSNEAREEHTEFVHSNHGDLLERYSTKEEGAIFLDAFYEDCKCTMERW